MSRYTYTYNVYNLLADTERTSDDVVSEYADFTEVESSTEAPGAVVANY